MRATLVIAAMTAAVAFGGFVQAQDAKAPAKKPAKKQAPKGGTGVLTPIQDANGLPRVLLIGDSISMGYTLDVRKLLSGKANLHRILTNGGPTSNGLANLDEWLGKGKWDVVHFNWGLHDLKYMGSDSKNLADPNAPTSRQQIPPDQYEKNLRELVGRLRKTGARLIWAATTPVPAGAQGRVHGDAARYNAIALKIMTDNGVAVDDLYALVLPRLSQLQQPKNVHFNAKGYQVLARQVADSILEALGKPKLGGAAPADWRSMITVAETKRDAQGNLLPLQSYDETIRRGMAFILKDHLKWFKGPPATLLDEKGQTQMPWVYYSNLQHNGLPFPSSADRFVSYPAFHHALAIRTFIGYWRYSGDARALEEAVKLADWNIAHSTPDDWAYGNLPYSTFQEKKPGGFRDKTGLMPDKAAIMALAYLQLHEATREARFLRGAEAVGHTLRRRQRPDGTWPFRVDPKTEKVIEEYSSSVIYAVMLFESLDKLNGNGHYRANRDLAWKWLLNGPIKTKDFRGFYEDIPDRQSNRTNYDCLDTIRYLLANRTDTNGYLQMAKQLNAWVEKVFLDKIKGFDPAEGIREQLACNVVMGIHSLNWASMLLELSRATGDDKMRQRATQTANYITYYLQPDNRILVGFTYPQWWYSCHMGVILYLLDFVKN